MKVTNTVKIDNIQERTINQKFNFKVGSKLTLSTDAGAFVNSGYILSTDTVNNKVYVAVNNNAWNGTNNAISACFTELFCRKSTSV